MTSTNVREHNTNLDALEAMVDKIGLANLVEALAEICSAKADHVQSNWQDDALAAVWDRDAAVLLKASGKVNGG